MIGIVSFKSIDVKYKIWEFEICITYYNCFENNLISDFIINSNVYLWDMALPIEINIKILTCVFVAVYYLVLRIWCSHWERILPISLHSIVITTILQQPCCLPTSKPKRETKIFKLQKYNYIFIYLCKAKQIISGIKWGLLV